MSKPQYVKHIDLVDGSRAVVGDPVEFILGFSKGKVGTLFRAWCSCVDGEVMATVVVYREEADVQKSDQYLMAYPASLRKVTP